MPMSMGFSYDFFALELIDTLEECHLKESLRVKTPKNKRKDPPIKARRLEVKLSSKIARTPSAIRITSGSSTAVWPRATKRPAFHPLLAPMVAVKVVKGPGARAPEADMITT